MARFFRKRPFLKSFVSLFILLILIAGTAFFLTRPVKADSLLGFNEGSGSTIHDSAGSASGTISNATWKPAAECVSGTCLYFNGTNANVSFGDENTFDFAAATNWTITGWFKTPTISSGIRMLISKYNATAGGYKIYMTSDGKMNFGIDDISSGFPKDIATSQSRYDDNLWHFVTATKTGTTSIILYIDGNRVGEKDTLSSTGTLANSDNFYIGIDGNGTSNPWLGYVDEVKVIIATANSATQVKSDFQKDSSVRGLSSRFGSDSSSLGSGLIGWWKMDEASGNPADSSGNGYTLTNNGTTPFSVGKFANGAGVFNGTSRYFSTASTITGVKTISFWIYPASTTNNYINLSTSTPVNITSTSGVVSTTGFTSPSVYVNGALGGTLAANTWQFVTVTDTNATSADAFQIGRVGASSYLSNNSLIDEVRLYNRTLSSSEVSQLANWGPDPVGYYKLDENSGTSAADSSGNGTNGTWGAGGWPHWVAGNFGGAANFTGSNNANEWISVPDSASNSLYSFTISAWVKTTSSDFWIASKFGQGPGNTLLFKVVGGLIELDAKDGSFSGLNTCDEWDVTNLNDGNWHYIAGSYNNVTGVGQLYADGNLITNTTGCSGTSTGNYGSGNPFIIGDNGASGQVDDLKIYNYVRTPSQIISDMNGSRSSTNTPVGHWKFNEGYGTTANNSGYGSSMNGTLSGATTPSWSNSGKFGKALSFNGTTAYVTMGNPNAAYFAGDFSISAWVNLTTNNAVHDILSKDGNSTNLSYRLYTDASGKLNLEVSSNGTATNTVTGATTLSTSTWYYVAGTYSPSKSLSIYVNGVNDGTNVTSIPSAIFKTTGNLEIGSQNGGGTNRMSGLVDEVKLFNYALTSDQIKSDYNTGGSQRMGSLGTDSSGNSSYTASTSYCIPGDATTCAGPVGEWKFDENTGTTANDTSGNGNTGTITPGVGKFTVGKIGSSYLFDGANTSVNAGTGSTLNNLPATGMSIAAWIYPKSQGENSAGFIVAKNVGTTPSAGWILQISGTNALTFTVDGTTDLVRTTSNSVLTTNSWNYVYVTWDGVITTAASSHIYVNGSETTYATTTNGTARVSDATSSLLIGNDSTQARTFDGNIDDVKVYNYARTPAQVIWDYNRGAPIASYKFDECTGSTANNSSLDPNGAAAGMNGTINPNTGRTTGTCGSGTSTEMWNGGTTGKFSGSLAFDGLGDYVQVANNTALGFSSDFTLASWIKLSTTSASDKEIIYKGQATTNNYYLDVEKPGASEYAGIGYFSNSTWSTLQADTVPLSVGSWYHIVGTYINSTKTLTLYVNGTPVKTATFANSPVTNSLPLYLGSGHNGSSTSSFFPGQIDDIRIYNYSLTPTQVKNLYNNSSAVRF